MGSVIDNEIHNMSIACEEIFRISKQQGLNAFFGSAISFNRFPNFVYIRDEVSKAILRGANIPEDIFLEKANNLLNEKDQKLRTETMFEALWRSLGRRCFQPFRLLAESAPTEPEPNHYLIAQLAEAEVFRSLFTTNWDRYIETAIRKLSNQQQHQSEKADLVVKLHGNIDIPSSIVFTESGLTKRLSLEAVRLLTANLDTRPTLVFGYSGNDHDILQAFCQAKNPQPVFWLCYNREDAQHLEEVWSRYGGLPPLKLIVPKTKKRCCAPVETFDLTELLRDLLFQYGLQADSEKTNQNFEETNQKFDEKGFEKTLSDWSTQLPVWKCKLAAAQLSREVNDSSNAIALAKNVAQARTLPLRATLEGKVLHASILWEGQGKSRQALKVTTSAINILETLPQTRYRSLLLSAYDTAAITLYKVGRLDDAHAMCMRGLNLKRSNLALRNTLAIVLFDMNRFDEALSEFDHVIRVARKRGRYSLLMDALNLRSLTLPEVSKHNHLLKKRVEMQLECERTRSELEQIARISKSSFYLGCALINSAEDLHLKGNILEALAKATEAFELDCKTNPEDPDAAVTCEITARILIDIAEILGKGIGFQNIILDGKRIIEIGLKLAKDSAEEKACLNALQAVFEAEKGQYDSAEKIMKRSLSYSIRYKKRENLFWAYLQQARIQALRSQVDGVAKSLTACEKGKYAKDNPMREQYFNCQKLIYSLSTQEPLLSYTDTSLKDIRKLATELDSQATKRAYDLVTARREAGKQNAYAPWNRIELLRAIYGPINKNHLKKLIKRIRNTYCTWKI